MLLEGFFLKKICFLYCTGMLYLINLSILSQSDVSLSIIYQLYDLALRVYILFL